MIMQNNRKIFIIIVIIGILTVAGYFVFVKYIKNNRGNQNIQTDAEAEQKAAFTEFIKSVAASDKDFDGIIDQDELKYGTSPTSADTDGDGLLDKTEIEVYKTNPLKADTDGDGKKDGYEVRHGANPLK